MKPIEGTKGNFEVTPNEMKRAELGMLLSGNTAEITRLTQGDKRTVAQGRALLVLAGNISLLDATNNSQQDPTIQDLREAAAETISSAVGLLFGAE